MCRFRKLTDFMPRFIPHARTTEQPFANFMFACVLKRGCNVRRPTRRHKNRALDASRRVTITHVHIFVIPGDILKYGLVSLSLLILTLI